MNAGLLKLNFCGLHSLDRERVYSVLLETDLSCEPEADSGLTFEEEPDEQRRKVLYRVVRLESNDPSEYLPSPPEAGAPSRATAPLNSSLLPPVGSRIADATDSERVLGSERELDDVGDGELDAPTSWTHVQALVERLNREQDLPAFVLSMRAQLARLAALSTLALASSSPALAPVAVAAAAAAADSCLESRRSKSTRAVRRNLPPTAAAAVSDESCGTGDSSMPLVVDASIPVRASGAAACPQFNRTFVVRAEDSTASDALPPPAAFS